MNIRSLTRGDGAVIGAAVLLFIASFLDYFSAGDCGSYCDKIDLPNAWDAEKLPLVLPTIFLAGIFGAALLVGGRFLPEGRKFGAVSLPQAGATLMVFSLWSAVWGMATAPDEAEMGAGAILGLIAALIGAAAALISPAVPALAAPLVPAGGAAPGPYGGQYPQQGGGYGYPGGPQGGQPGPYGAQPGQAQPQYGQQPGQPQGGQPGQPGQPGPGQSAGGPQGATGGAPDPNFQPFWFAVPMARPLFPEDGSPQPIAELAPGTWYLAVEQRGQALIAQTQDGRRGVLQDTSNIQRG
ncbi:DUF5336 domain-containing protein [Streptomyces spirodelae]|uniref:Integral membrane protein n=1 Tax=Streptomyces spirodelae TaxID=2812904 RepID=A0ABS3WNT6_9ACTN|nr:DUF5336 domain-containing protein [Streptomyces spirodelae]MBO8184537.1 hypothetical protein [Streptomyces spirodelae]